MTKPPVGGSKCLFKWASHSTIHSFRNELIGCRYEQVTESLTHSIHSNTWIRSVTKHRCVLLGDTQSSTESLCINLNFEKLTLKTGFVVHGHI